MVWADSQFSQLNGSLFILFYFLFFIFFWVLQSGYRKNRAMEKFVKNIKKSGSVQGSAFWGLEVFLTLWYQNWPKIGKFGPQIWQKIFAKKSILRVTTFLLAMLFKFQPYFYKGFFYLKNSMKPFFWSFHWRKVGFSHKSGKSLYK